MPKKKPSILKEIREKQLPEINFAFQKAISYSQLSMFNECPKNGHCNIEKATNNSPQVFTQYLELLYMKYYNTILQ